MSMYIGKPVNSGSNAQQINTTKDLPEPTHQTASTQHIAQTMGLMPGSQSQLAGHINSSKLPTNSQISKQNESFVALAKNAIKNVALNLALGFQNIVGDIKAKLHNIGLSPQQKAKVCKDECTKVIQKLVSIKNAIKEMKLENKEISKSQIKEWNREIRKLTPRLNNAKSLLKELANIKPEHDSNLRHSLELAKDIVVTYRFLKNENPELFKQAKGTIKELKKFAPENVAFNSEASINAGVEGKHHIIKAQTNFSDRVMSNKEMEKTEKGYSPRAEDDANSVRKTVNTFFEANDEATPDYTNMGKQNTTFQKLVDSERVSFDQLSRAVANLIVEYRGLVWKETAEYLSAVFYDIVQQQDELKKKGLQAQSFSELKKIFIERIEQKNVSEEDIDLKTFKDLVQDGNIPRNLMYAPEFKKLYNQYISQQKCELLKDPEFRKLFKKHQQNEGFYNDPDYKKLLEKYQSDERGLRNDPELAKVFYKHHLSNNPECMKLLKKYDLLNAQDRPKLEMLKKNQLPTDEEYQKLLNQYESEGWNPTEERTIQFTELKDELSKLPEVTDRMFDNLDFQIVMSDILNIEVDSPFTHPDELAIQDALDQMENDLKEWGSQS